MASATMGNELPKSSDVLSRAGILIVEDDPESNLMMQMLLGLWGYKNISSAETGREAIHCLTNDQTICLVLLDLGLPGPDGFEVMRAVARSRKAPIGVIAVTAYRGVEHQCRFHASASESLLALGYLTKPVDISELKIFLWGCLELVLHRRRGWLNLESDL